MDDVSVLSSALTEMVRMVTGGFGLLGPQVGVGFSAAMSLAFSLAVLFWLWEGRVGTHVPLLQMMFKFVAVGWVIEWFPEGFPRLMDAAVATGTGLVPLEGLDLRDPGFIVQVGLNAVVPLLDRIDDMGGGPIDFFYNFVDIFVFIFATAVCLAAFVVLAIQAFMAYLEWRVMSIPVFLCVPLAVFAPTSFAAERAIGYVASSAVRLLTIGVIVGMTGGVLMTVTFDGAPTLDQAFGVLVLSVAILVCGIKFPAMAAGLVNGGPSLDAAGSLRGLAKTAQAGLRAAGTGGLAAVGTVGMAALGVAAAMRGLQGAASGGSAGSAGGSARAAGSGGGASGALQAALTSFGNGAVRAAGWDAGNAAPANANRAPGGGDRAGKAKAGPARPSGPGPGGLGHDVGAMASREATAAIESRARKSPAGDGSAPTPSQWRDAGALGLDITGMTGSQAEAAVTAQMAWLDNYKASGGKGGAPGAAAAEAGGYVKEVSEKYAPAGGGGSGSAAAAAAAASAVSAAGAARSAFGGGGGTAPTRGAGTRPPAGGGSPGAGAVSMAGRWTPGAGSPGAGPRGASQGAPEAASPGAARGTPSGGGAPASGRGAAVRKMAGLVEEEANTLREMGRSEAEVAEGRAWAYHDAALAVADGYRSAGDWPSAEFVEGRVDRIDAMPDLAARGESYRDLFAGIARAEDEATASPRSA